MSSSHQLHTQFLNLGFCTVGNGLAVTGFFVDDEDFSVSGSDSQGINDAGSNIFGTYSSSQTTLIQDSVNILEVGVGQSVGDTTGFNQNDTALVCNAGDSQSITAGQGSEDHLNANLIDQTAGFRGCCCRIRSIRAYEFNRSALNAALFIDEVHSNLNSVQTLIAKQSIGSAQGIDRTDFEGFCFAGRLFCPASTACDRSQYQY